MMGDLAEGCEGGPFFLDAGLGAPFSMLDDVDPGSGWDALNSVCNSLTNLASSSGSEVIIFWNSIMLREPSSHQCVNSSSSALEFHIPLSQLLLQQRITLSFLPPCLSGFEAYFRIICELHFGHCAVSLLSSWKCGTASFNKDSQSVID